MCRALPKGSFPFLPELPAFPKPPQPKQQLRPKLRSNDYRVTCRPQLQLVGLP